MIDSFHNKKIILDTNVLISVFLAHRDSSNKFRRLLEFVLKNGIVYASNDTFAELVEVLKRDKFKKYLPGSLIKIVLEELKKEFQFAKPTISITDCRDKDDNKFLELAVFVNADVIVTGDKDLLELNPYKNISIITTNEAFKLIGS